LVFDFLEIKIFFFNHLSSSINNPFFFLIPIIYSIVA
jgi:hypothetical protein